MRQIISRSLTALILAASLAAPVRAEEKIDSGAYLAARVAETENDFRAAAGWYGKAIIADEGNAQLLEGAILAEVGIGDFALAIDAAKLRKGLEGDASQLAELVLFADEAKREDYAAIIAGAEGPRDMGDLANSLVTVWAKVGEGKMSEALADFDAVTKK